MTKQFKIDYNGKEDTLEIEDTPRAGVIIKILKNAIKYKQGNALPEPDLDEYLIGLATNLITKAPWTLQTPDSIRNLPWTTYAQLCEILGDVFPLEGFLFPAGKLMYGRKLEKVAVSPSQTDSTTSSPSSDSPSDK